MVKDTYYSDKLGAISPENVEKVVKAVPYLSSGVSRNVYDLGAVVLKVNKGYDGCGSCASELAVWEEYAGTEFEQYLAPILAADPNGEWLIMEKCSGVGSIDYYDRREMEHKLNSIGIGDLHEYNVGRRENGDIVAIDYAFTRDVGMRDDDHCNCDDCNGCGCGEHGCGICYPNGCDCCCSLHDYDGCATFEGCNRRECSACYNTAKHLHQPSLFGFVQPTARALCSDCMPSNVRQAMSFATKCRIMGNGVQGKLAIAYGPYPFRGRRLTAQCAGTRTLGRVLFPNMMPRHHASALRARRA